MYEHYKITSEVLSAQWFEQFHKRKYNIAFVSLFMTLANTHVLIIYGTHLTTHTKK